MRKKKTNDIEIVYKRYAFMYYDKAVLWIELADGVDEYNVTIYDCFDNVVKILTCYKYNKVYIIDNLVKNSMYYCLYLGNKVKDIHIFKKN
jgi:hypothetical protein